MLFLHKILLSLFILFSTLLYASSPETKTIKTAIASKYLELYPSLNIVSLEIKPLGRMPKKFTDYHIETIYLSEASLKRNHGTFSVLYANAKKKKKRFFKFTLDATIGVYTSSRIIKNDQIINPHYVSYQDVTFKSFPFKPIDGDYFYNYSSKRNIKEDRIITINDLKRVLDVKRGAMIDAKLYDGNVALTFKVKAVQEGNIGDIIKVKRGHYKNFNAQITSTTSVEIIE